MFKRAISALLFSAGLLLVSPFASAQNKAYTVTSSDGVPIAVQESGNPDGPPIIFIHGLLGSRLNWDAQVQSTQLQRFRLITYDMRGHGLSGKPVDAASYTDGRRWADDLAAVIDAAQAGGQAEVQSSTQSITQPGGLVGDQARNQARDQPHHQAHAQAHDQSTKHPSKPVLVGWSLGGVVISNYLAKYGDGRIAGAMYVNGVIEMKPDQIVSHPTIYRDLVSPDLKTHLDTVRDFLRLCFHTQPDAPLFERLLANAAMASWDMQRAVMSISVEAAEGLGNARVPLLLLYGERDALVQARPAIARAQQLRPGIQSELYAESGHAPFLEEATRFNADLSAFVDAIR
ncbi:alpha/beta fold hydrolase [Pigmentiphaga aceris]